MKPSLLFLSILSFAAPIWSQEQPLLTIDLSKPAVHSSPILYGLMTEEISHSYDGGLYAQLLRNPLLKEYTSESSDSVPLYWSAVGDARISVDSTQTVTGTGLQRALKIDCANSSMEQNGVSNEGYWGIPVWPKTTYELTFHARGLQGFTGPLTFDLASADHQTVYGRAVIPKITSEWTRYSIKLITRTIPGSTSNRFFITTPGRGTFYIAGASMFARDKEKQHRFRKDLMEKMAAMHPKFLRFPGGNYLDPGNYPWKKTIGPLAQREGHDGAWGYYSTDGLGLLEFLYWCEDLNIEPILAVSDGRDWLSKRDVPHAIDKKILDSLVQEALDEIEYVTGDAHTKWGALRARHGHPKPFNLRYVEIGNEDFFDNTVYDERFTPFYDAIKARYPHLQVISTSVAAHSRRADVIDEHYYDTPAWFENGFHRYDTADRNGPKIFVGEWASHSGTPTTDYRAALGDAVWLLGIERNADIVVMQCYAPLLCNINAGAYQWPHNLIGYDAMTSYGSPSYHMQCMFGQHYGDRIIANALSPVEKLYQSVTYDSAKHLLYIKLVNTDSVGKDLNVNIDGAKLPKSEAKCVSMKAASLDATNTINDPERIVPFNCILKNIGESFSYYVDPRSITVLTLKVRKL